MTHDPPDAGYTLVEVVVAAVVSGVLVLVALTAYLAAARSLARWEDAGAVDGDALAVAVALSRDARRSGRPDVGPGAVSFPDGDRPASYEARDGALSRNGAPMLTPGVRLADFEAAETLSGLDVRFTLEAGRATASRRVVVVARAPDPWPDATDRPDP